MPPPPPSTLFLLFLLAPLLLLLPSAMAQDGSSDSSNSTSVDYQLGATEMLDCYQRMVATASAYDGITSQPPALNISTIQEVRFLGIRVNRSGVTRRTVGAV